MSTVATGIKKIQIGAAAAAITAAAVLTPATIAQARPDLMPAMPVLDSISTDMFGTDPILGPVSFSLDANNIIPWWIGDNNANASTLAAPGGTTIFEFSVLSFVPGFLRPLAGWFVALIPNFVICFAGLGFSVIGPYGTVSLKTGAC